MANRNPRKHSPPNPLGKGGFKDNPHHRNPGGYKRVDTFRYWFDTFKEMTGEELEKWKLENPEEKRKNVANIALKRIENALNDLLEFREVADRTEGKAPQSIDLTTKGESLNEFTDEQVGRIADRVTRRRKAISNPAS